MKYNGEIEPVIVMTDATAEPVTLDELKQHLNMFFDTDGSFTFTDDDTLLTRFITEAREIVENYTGLSLAPKTLKAVLRNELGGVEIPSGPINSIISVKDKDGNAVTYTTTGVKFKKIQSPCSCYLEVVYTTDWTTFPNSLKLAIKEQAAYLYNHRGDEVDTSGICEAAIVHVAKHTRNAWLV